MAKRNLTIQLEEDIIRDAKVLAAQRGTSVGGLVTQEIRKATAAAARYEEARRRALEAMDNAIPRGGYRFRREDLYGS
jgi:hypothetical protein